jgi:hypothetical protein
MKRLLKSKLVLSLVTVVLLTGAIAVSLPATITQAHAAESTSSLVTQGDVEAILHTVTSGGGILFHEHPVVGFEDYPFAAITPLSNHNGTHYCVDDWHVVRIAIANSVDNVIFFTKEQVITDLEATTVTLTLDGVTLPTIRTPIIMLNAGFWKQRFGLPGPFFAFQTGSILSPAALSVGDHTSGLVLTDPAFGTFQDSSTFTVDPSGTGACLQG